MESLTFPADFLTVQGYQAEESPQDTENHDTLHVVEPVKVDYSLAVEFGWGYPKFLYPNPVDLILAAKFLLSISFQSFQFAVAK